MTDPHRAPDLLDDLQAFATFRADAAPPSDDARARAHRAVADEPRPSRRARVARRSPGLRATRRRRLAVAGVLVAAVAVVVAVAAWPSRSPSPVDLLAEARAAVAPQRGIVHYTVTVTADVERGMRGTIERTEGWVRGRPDGRTEGREVTRRTRAGGAVADAAWTETSWRPDARNPGRTLVLERSAAGRTPAGPVTSRLVGSARPTGSVFAAGLDPRTDGRWRLVRRTDDLVVLDRSAGGTARVTLELDRRTSLPRRFVAEDTLADGRRSRFVTEIRGERLPEDAAGERLLRIDAPSRAAVRSWGTPEASRLIEATLRRTSPPDGLVRVRSETIVTSRDARARGGVLRRAVRRTGAFEFRDGLMLRGRLRPIHPDRRLGTPTVWSRDLRDADRILVRTGSRPAVSVGRPDAQPVPVAALGDRTDGWRVARRTARRIVLRAAARQHHAGAELVLDRRTGELLRATTTPGLAPPRGRRVRVSSVQRIRVTVRPFRAADARLVGGGG